MSRENSSSVAVKDLHMMKDKRSDSTEAWDWRYYIAVAIMSMQYILWARFTARFIICLLSGDPAYFMTMTSAVLLNTHLDFFSWYCNLSVTQQTGIICRWGLGIAPENDDAEQNPRLNFKSKTVQVKRGLHIPLYQNRLSIIESVNCDVKHKNC